MKIEKIVLRGGTLEFSISSVRERIVASISILLLGKISGGLGVAVLTNAELEEKLEPKLVSANDLK